ncbi:MAG: UDP-3-O-(3-hydroxymyristoyl)glucosamine N-acyltransferase [Phycisphaerales bacterium]
MDNSTQRRTLREIAEHVNGRVLGSPDTVISGAATLSEAREGDISFLVNRKYEKQLETTKAGAVIAGREIPGVRVPLILAKDPYFAFTQVLVLLYGQRKHEAVGISPRAAISPNAKIGEDCHIHDFATVASNARIGRGCVIYPCVYIGEGSEIGENTVIHANVVVYEKCQIGERVIIHANSTVGTDGFGFATHDGVHHKIPQVAGVVIEDDVEIGASCSIERGTLSDTVIGRGSKLGDLVTIGHGTRLGPHCLIVPQVGIAGSATLGHHCTLGGQVGVVGHITLGNNVTVAAQAGVINSIADGQTVAGAPAVDVNRARRAYAMIPYLPQIRQDIRNLQSQLDKIAAAMDAQPKDPTESQDVE